MSKLNKESNINKKQGVTNDKQKYIKTEVKANINNQKLIRSMKEKQKPAIMDQISYRGRNMKEKRNGKSGQASEQKIKNETADKKRSYTSKQEKPAQKTEQNKLKKDPNNNKNSPNIEKSKKSKSQKNNNEKTIETNKNYEDYAQNKKSGDGISEKKQNMEVSNQKQKIGSKDISEIKKSERKLLLLEQQIEAIEKKQRQIDNNKIKVQNYEDIMLKYKQLAGKQLPGKQKGTGLQHNDKVKNVQARQSTYPMTMGNKKTVFNDKVQEMEVENIIESRKIQQVQLEQISKMKKSRNIENNIKLANRTKIRFLTQKQHELSTVLDGSENKLVDAKQIKFKMDTLNSTRRSLSLPTIQKNTPNETSKTKNQLKNNMSLKSQKSGKMKNEKRGLSSDQRLNKQKQLNKISFMLSNLKQRAGIQSQQRNATQFNHKANSPSKIYDYISQTSGNASFFSQNSPNKLTKSKLTVLELSNSPSKVYSRELQKKESPEDKQTAEKTQNNIKIEVRSEKVQQNEKRTVKIKNLLQKETEINKLQEIKQDIENENNEKEQLLKQHRALNKNLQISILEKRERINKLQARINQYQLEEQDIQNDKLGSKEPETLFLTQLQLQKIVKEKQYKQQQEKLREELKKTEKRIAEQQERYKNLRQSQINIKDEELKQKEVELQVKSKQMTIQLQQRNKELQQIIKKEQQKSKLYKQQLKQQALKNEQISKQLKKQEQLQSMLLQQIQKIGKERMLKKQKRETQKSKQKVRLIEQIKQLEETWDRMILQYQRESQAASSIFEAMRLKNLQMEDNLSRKRKEKASKNQIAMDKITKSSQSQGHLNYF